MDLDPDLKLDLYRDPQQVRKRPVPLPRVRSDSGSKPGLNPKPEAPEQSADGDELHGQKLFQKWKSLEKGTDYELRQGPQLKSRSLPRPGPRPGPGLGPGSDLLKKDSSLPRVLNFRGQSSLESDHGPKSLKDTSIEESDPEAGPKSLKDRSMETGIGFRRTPQTTTKSDSEAGPDSLKTDKSIDRNIDFRELPHTSSEFDPEPDPGPERFKKDQSLHRDIDFRRSPQIRSDQSWRSQVEPIFQRLEMQMVAFVKQQLQRFLKVLISEEPDSEEQDSDLVLRLTVDFLRRMDQEQLAEILLTKSSGSVCQGKLKSHLRQRFSQVFEGVAKAGSPAPLDEIYTELHITEGEASDVDAGHEVRLIESASRQTAAPLTIITCRDIFKPRPTQRPRPIGAKHTQGRPIRTVLTKGVAGVGKTVLTQKFSLDWAEGRANQDVQLLFPFTFRELNALKDTEFSLMGLIQHCFSQSKGLQNIQHLQVLFIFDGLDECRLDLDFSRTRVLTDPAESASVEELLMNLIRGTLLPSARVWITTRPAAADQIPAECVSMVTEVQGFTDEQKEQYFRNRFKDQRQAEVVISHIKKSHILYSMCYVPIFDWILCEVLTRIMEQTAKPELPKTLTEMYIHFLVVQAKVKNIKFQGRTGADPHWTEDTKEMVLALGKLAFEQLQKGNLIFYESDLSECGLDAAEVARYSGVFKEVFKEEAGLYQTKVYCFIHLSVQEFLAALHIHQTFFSSGQNLLVTDGDAYWPQSEEEFYKSAVDVCMVHKNGHLDLVLRFLLGLSLPANQRLLQGLMSQTRSERTNQETAQYVQKKVNEELSTERILNLLHCLNELQDCSLEQQMQNHLRSGTLDPSRLSSGQWAALVLLLLSSDRDLEQFDLRKFCPSENALLRLMPVLQASSKATLAGCHLSSDCCSDLGSVLIGSRLKELDLSNNDLRDSGVEQLCQGLKSANCELHTLRLSICNLTSRCCSDLGSVLVRSELKELDLSDNDLQDSGVQQLCTGLKSATCGLHTLRLAGCLLTERGCSFLATALSTNPSHLQELDVSYNSLNDGVQLLTALRDDHKHRLTTLKMDFYESCWKFTGLSKYACELSLDLISANPELKILNRDRRVEFTEENQNYSQHPQRFDWYPQVLCSLSAGEADSDPGPGSKAGPFLSGRSYWEVEWSGGVSIAVTDSKIRRRGDTRSCVFGFNDHSWRLFCSEGRYAVCHDSKQQVLTVVPFGSEGRVGVFLDPDSGTLSFYDVRGTSAGDHRTHLYTFHARFPQSLLPGIGFGIRSYKSHAFLCGVYFEVVGDG